MVDLSSMRGMGLDEGLLKRLVQELESGPSAPASSAGGGILGLALRNVDWAKLASDARHRRNLKDIRSRIFFKILDEAAIAAGHSFHADAFDLAASVADLRQRLAGAEARAKKLEEIYWHLFKSSNNEEVFIARIRHVLKSIEPGSLYMK